jgi:uncharacterized protein (TIGR02391 family)
MAEIPINIAFDDELHSKYEKEYDAGNFTGAVKTAILFLTECIRDRTDLDMDGDALITKALSPKSPLIRLNGLSTTSEIDEQMGHMMILQGIYKGIRNPRNHNLKSDDRFTCDSILILVNYYVKIIKKAKTFFDFDEIMSVVNDRHFDRSTEYSEEIAGTIPSNKIFDTLISLIDNTKNSNYHNISYIVRSSMELLDEKELNKFYDHCSALLQKTNDHSLIRALVFALNGVWDKIKKASRIRIEGILIDALKNMRFDEIHDTDDYGNYYKNHVLNEEGELAEYLRFLPIPYTKKVPIVLIHNSIKSKLELGGLYVGYVLKYFSNFLFNNHEHLNSIYNDVAVRLLGQGNETLYEELTSGSVADEEFDPYYTYDASVSDAIKKYERAKKKDELLDDVPF